VAMTQTQAWRAVLGRIDSRWPTVVRSAMSTPPLIPHEDGGWRSWSWIWQYQRRRDERDDVSMPLRSLHFGRDGGGLVTFLMYPPDDLVLVVKI
jgi:hypothetical protein